MGLLDQTNIPLLSKALDAYSLRQKVIASNVANIQTQGYLTKEVRFEEELTNALQASSVLPPSSENDPAQPVTSPLASLAPRVIDSDAPVVNNGEEYASGVNNVDIDREMAELAKNQIRFKFATKLISESFKGIQKSIRGMA